MKYKTAFFVYSLLGLFPAALFVVILIIKGSNQKNFPLSLTLLTGAIILFSYWAVLPQKEPSNHQLYILNNPWLKLLLAATLGGLLAINLSSHLDAQIAGIIALVLLGFYFVLLEMLKKI